jgi:hypothetical protein
LQRLKLQYDALLSNSAFKFNLRRYIVDNKCGWLVVQALKKCDAKQKKVRALYPEANDLGQIRLEPINLNLPPYQPHTFKHNSSTPLTETILLPY